MEEKIPWLDGSYSTEIFGAEGGPAKYPYYYSLGATYGDQIKILMKWVKENHKGKERARVGFVYSPTAWGRDGTPEGIAYAKKLGLDVVAEIEYPYSATDATTQATTLRKAKTQYILFHGFSGAGNYTAIFFKTIRKFLPDATIMGTGAGQSQGRRPRVAPRRGPRVLGRGLARRQDPHLKSET